MDKFANFNEFDFQVILYSKGWYKETNVMDDIRQLISKICLMDTKFIKDKDVVMQVALTVYKVMAANGGPTSCDLGALYEEVWEGRLWERKESITMKDQVEALLRVIRMKDITCYPRLPKPDPKYLPWPSAGKDMLWDEQDKDYEKTLASLLPSADSKVLS